MSNPPVDPSSPASSLVNESPVGGTPLEPRRMQSAGPGIGGKLTVLAMFALGLTAVGIMYWYWDARTREFRPLTMAVGREFKGSLPKVEGGFVRKGPRRLNIALRVNFDPSQPNTPAPTILRRVLELTQKHVNLTDFEEVTIRLIHLPPERTSSLVDFTLPTAEIAAVLADPNREIAGSTP